jgi:hypothetical protein
MNGLRLYTNAIGEDNFKVFYSRRANGPYYCWRFEEKLGRWRGLRVQSFEFTPGELCVAAWKGVPTALQVRLDEHYLE